MSHGRKQNMMTHVTWQKAEQDNMSHGRKQSNTLHDRKQKQDGTCYMAESKARECYVTWQKSKTGSMNVIW